MRLTKLFGLLSLISTMACFGQETNQLAVTGYPAAAVIPLSLDDAIRLAIQHNLGLQIERYNAPILAYAVHSQNGAYYDPVLATTAARDNVTTEGGGFNTATGLRTPPSQSENKTVITTIGGNLPTGMRYELYNDLGESRSKRPGFDTNLFFDRTHTFSSSAGIRVSQPLLRNLWTDSSRTGIQLAKRDLRIAELTLEDAVQGIVFSVGDAYYKLVGALEGVKVSEADLQVKQQNFDETRRKVEVGRLAQLDEKQAQSEVATARIALVRARNTAADAADILRGLISDNYINLVGRTIEPTDKLIVIPLVVDFPTSVRTALAKRPSVLAARERLERESIQLKYDYNQLFPSLDVFASWGMNGLGDTLASSIADIEDRDFQEDRFGILFSMPLTLKKERNNYKAAKLSKKQAIINQKSVEDGVVADVDNAVRSLVNAHMRVQLAREGVEFADANLLAERRKFTAGTSTSFFVLEASSRLTVARNEEIQARVDYNTALNSLMRREGTILEYRKIDVDMAIAEPVPPSRP